MMIGLTNAWDDLDQSRDAQYDDTGCHYLVCSLFEHAFRGLSKGKTRRRAEVEFLFSAWAEILASYLTQTNIETMRDQAGRALKGIGEPVPTPCPRCRTGFVLEPNRVEYCPDCIQDLTPIYCAWCGVWMKGPETADQALISHSICPACTQEQSRAVDKLRRTS